MNSRLATLGALVILAILATDPSPAAAQCLGPYRYLRAGGWSYDYDGYASDYVPYYVRNPPVYYGYSILRAVPPTFLPPPSGIVQQSTQTPQPVLIINPYVQPQAGSPPSAEKLARAQATIRNPYVR